MHMQTQQQQIEMISKIKNHCAVDISERKAPAHLKPKKKFPFFYDILCV